MTTEEVGAYFLLLCKSWRESPVASLPSDDLVLARWARLTPDRWSVCKPSVLAPFKFGPDSRWHQKRLRQEYDKIIAVRRERSKAANKRWNKNLDANALHKQSIPIPIPIPSNSKPTEREEFARKSFERFWEAYPEHRRLDRDVCFRIWLGLSPIDQDRAAECIPAWVGSESWAEPRFIPNAETFLLKRRWESTPLEGGRNGTKAAVERLRTKIKNTGVG